MRKSWKNGASDLPNRGPGPLKSRPEPSKALCYKDTNLRRFKSRLLYARRRHFEPTWLQVGGPRASKIEAKIEKIDIKKQHVFEIDFWVARAWFLIGFWMVFWIPNPCKKQHEEKRPRAILYCKNQYKIDVGAFATEALWSKNRWKIACLLEHRFRRRFGRIWGGFWVAENLDFRTFFVIFSKQILKHCLEGQKIEKKSKKLKKERF